MTLTEFPSTLATFHRRMWPLYDAEVDRLAIFVLVLSAIQWSAKVESSSPEPVSRVTRVAMSRYVKCVRSERNVSSYGAATLQEVNLRPESRGTEGSGSDS
jgi:hypothetical protein